MKYCLSNRQPDSLLKTVDEIKISMRDFRAIPEYIEKFPTKTLILEFKNELPDDFGWDVIAAYADKMEGRFHCALSDLGMARECAIRGIKFYYKYPVTTFFELAGLKDLGVSYVLVGTPLMFDLKNVAAYDIPLRAIPNLAYEPYIKHVNGIYGGWVRPEDVESYGTYIDTFEFYAPGELDKEAVLLKIYSKTGSWPGNLNLLIENFNYDFDNRLLIDAKGFAERRMNCKQRCLSGRICRYCEHQMNSLEVIKKYREYKDALDL